MDLERRDRPRPDDAVGVRELLDGGAGDARRADPVAAHHDRPLLAGLVEILRAERFREPGAELEDVADLDHPLEREGPATLRARLAGKGDVEVGEPALEITTRRHTAHVKARAVRADDVAARA